MIADASKFSRRFFPKRVAASFHVDQIWICWRTYFRWEQTVVYILSTFKDAWRCLFACIIAIVFQFIKLFVESYQRFYLGKMPIPYVLPRYVTMFHKPYSWFNNLLFSMYLPFCKHIFFLKICLIFPLIGDDRWVNDYKLFTWPRQGPLFCVNENLLAFPF